MGPPKGETVLQRSTRLYKKAMALRWQAAYKRVVAYLKTDEAMCVQLESDLIASGKLSDVTGAPFAAATELPGAQFALKDGSPGGASSKSSEAGASLDAHGEAHAQNLALLFSQAAASADQAPSLPPPAAGKNKRQPAPSDCVVPKRLRLSCKSPGAGPTPEIFMAKPSRQVPVLARLLASAPSPNLRVPLALADAHGDCDELDEDDDAAESPGAASHSRVSIAAAAGPARQAKLGKEAAFKPIVSRRRRS